MTHNGDQNASDPVTQWYVRQTADREVSSSNRSGDNENYYYYLFIFSTIIRENEEMNHNELMIE